MNSVLEYEEAESWSQDIQEYFRKEECAWLKSE